MGKSPTCIHVKHCSSHTPAPESIHISLKKCNHAYVVSRKNDVFEQSLCAGMYSVGHDLCCQHLKNVSQCMEIPSRTSQARLLALACAKQATITAASAIKVFMRCIPAVGIMCSSATAAASAWPWTIDVLCNTASRICSRVMIRMRKTLDHSCSSQAPKKAFAALIYTHTHSPPPPPPYCGRCGNVGCVKSLFNEYSMNLTISRCYLLNREAYPN